MLTQKKIKNACTSLKWLYSVLMRHKPTKEHKKAWEKVERFFFIKANIVMVSQTAQNLI